MSYTRRSVLKHGTVLAAAGTAVGAMPTSLTAQPLMALLYRRPELVPPIEDPDLKRLTDASLDAARVGGVTYADVRLTHNFHWRVGSFPVEEELMNFGVRVLVDGYWGFASSPVWSVDEADRLSQAAIENARANTLGKPRTLELAPVAPIANGHWTMPIKDDPFVINKDEVSDFARGIPLYEGRLPGVRPLSVSMDFFKQEKAFASTAGHYFTQRVYRTSASVQFEVRSKDGHQKTSVAIDTLTPAGAGFEYIRDQPVREYIRARYEEALEDMALPVQPVDVGRYHMIFDAASVAQFLSGTIGAATELDRALGFEANSGGTSYIMNPMAEIGTLKIGSPDVTVTANRTQPQGAATVKWDDEGVETHEFTLIKNGVLADMQTNREGAAWLGEHYQKRQQPIVSHGTAFAPSAGLSPLPHCANLELVPASNNATFQSLIEGMDKGIVMKRATVDMDFQQMTGWAMGDAFVVKGGKRVARLFGAGTIFRTPELWNSIMALGGQNSRMPFGLKASKGQPAQASNHTVTAVPVATKELTVVDIARKA